MEFLEVRLQVAAERLGETSDFYAATLGVDDGRFVATALQLLPAAGEPFYHFALLLPGDRFEAALDWARRQVELLPGGDIDEVVFDFSSWDALACYFHDPAGNIVELIAHRGIGEAGRRGLFDPRELLGFSELGLVGDVTELATCLERLDLRLWDGDTGEPGRLAFVGEKARTLILSPPGRGWLPTGRPAEAWPVEVVVSGEPARVLDCGAHLVRRR